MHNSFANFRALIHNLEFFKKDPVEWIVLVDALKALNIYRWHELKVKINPSARDDADQPALYGLGIEKELKELKVELDQFHHSEHGADGWADKVVSGGPNSVDVQCRPSKFSD